MMIFYSFFLSLYLVLNTEMIIKPSLSLNIDNWNFLEMTQRK